MSDSRKVAFFLALFLAGALFWQQGLHAEMLDSQVAAFIRQMYADDDIRINFGPLPHNANGEVRVKTVAFSKVPDATGDGVCLVSIEGKNGKDSEVYVSFKVMVKRSLYMAKRNIEKGDVIHLGDLSVRESYLNGVSAAYPVGINDVVGKEAKKEIPAGAIIMNQLLQGVMAVQKGEAVSITAENKRLSVQGKGTALEKGKMGDLIRVKSQGGKEIVGKVTGSNAVAVQF
jgi:flagella basal body P-ring formation protein FlgA